MPIQEWSESILVVDLRDEPQFSEDISNLMKRLNHGPDMDVVLDLHGCEHVNSSNIASLLRVRTKLIRTDRQLRVCCVPDAVWGVLLVTSLDKVFVFAPDVATALASLQLKS